MTLMDKIRGMAVHCYTASGIFPAAAALVELCHDQPDIRLVFVYLLITTFIDATDGPLARRFDVKHTAPSIDGRTIDDLLDYLTFALIPLLAVYRMGWLADPLQWTWTLGGFASLLGFANVTAKDESGGFFRGFPSYWNIYAFYAGLMSTHYGPWPSTILLIVLAIATVSPIWLLYPNLTPPPYKKPLLMGAAIWSLALLAMLPWYPDIDPIWMWLSLIYPALYTALSFYLRSQTHRDPPP